MSDKNTIIFDHVEKTYQKNTVIRDLNLTIPAGHGRKNKTTRILAAPFLAFFHRSYRWRTGPGFAILGTFCLTDVTNLIQKCNICYIDKCIFTYRELCQSLFYFLLIHGNSSFTLISEDL